MPEKIRQNHSNIILFDGVCNLCNSFVNFLLKKDKQEIFRFASLQSTFGKEILDIWNENENADKTVFYLRNNNLYKKSDAALHIIKDVGGAYSLLFAFIIVPRFIRDYVYTVISRNRYKWFGKRNTCRMPTPEEKVRFLK
jgi:predicted DCC family thiol-disulfide oxidoreductase YuxK